ncbi:site-specific integrase [Salmonella enterica]|uniref:site-specific integrase n=1 Tax=Salmonella enterica TaxID=28901 RepID=UPI00111BCAEF|nr:site-specific integrase [Salmonella enterica]EAW8114196.1 hypothetical protein [Salmonella enterica]
MHSASALLLTEQWLTILSNLGRASATIKAYRSALTHFFAFCEIHDIAPERASFEDIAGYIRPQLPDMPSSVASATLQLRLSALRLWYDCKRAARTVLTGMCYSVGSATRQGSSSPTRFIGQSAMTSRT